MSSARKPPTTHPLDPGYWTRAVWILTALPPTRRPRPPAPSRRLFADKLRQYAELAWKPTRAEGRHPMKPVTTGAAIGPALIWWVERATQWTFDTPAVLVSGCSASLLAATGSLTEAHALMLKTSERLADGRDEAFTEAQIREQRVKRLAGGTDRR